MLAAVLVLVPVLEVAGVVVLVLADLEALLLLVLLPPPLVTRMTTTTMITTIPASSSAPPRLETGGPGVRVDDAGEVSGGEADR